MSHHKTPADWLLDVLADASVGLTSFNLGRRDAGAGDPWWATFAPLLALGVIHGGLAVILGMVR
jgi:hypothetical protein